MFVLALIHFRVFYFCISGQGKERERERKNGAEVDGVNKRSLCLPRRRSAFPLHLRKVILSSLSLPRRSRSGFRNGNL